MHNRFSCASSSNRLLKNPSRGVILSEAKDLLCLFSRRYSRCFAALSMTDGLFQQPAKALQGLADKYHDDKILLA